MAKVSKKSAETQKYWEDRLCRAKKVRRDWKDLFQVDLAREYLDGKQMPSGWNKDEWITVNIIYSTLKSQLPALYSVDPYFYVKLAKSYTPDRSAIESMERKGKIRQAMINYVKREERLKEKARLSIQDAHFAYGVCKVHYYAEQKENPDKDLAMTDDNGELLYDDDRMPIKEPDVIPVNERYCITRIHPDDFLFDEDAGPLPDDWHWLAQQVRMPWNKAVKSGKYAKTALDSLKSKVSDSPDSEEERDRQTRKKGQLASLDVKGRSERGITKPGKTAKDPETLIAWEIYDLDEQKWLTIAEGAESPLAGPDELPPGVEDHPFSILRFTLRDDSPYPIPPMSQGIDPQREFNTARSDVLKHRKRFNRKYEVNVNALIDPDRDLVKLETGDDGAVIPVQMLGAIGPIQDAPMDQQRYLEINYLRQDMIEVLGGASDESRGIAGADSATQAGILDKRLEMKEGDALSMVIDFLKEIASKLDQIVEANITKDEAVKVAGPQGEYWEMIRQSDYQDIEGQYQYDVNIGATMPRLPQMERQSWIAFLSFLGNNPQFLLSRRLLTKAAEMHHIDDEALIDDLMGIGKQMMSGQLPVTGQSGSLPNVGEARPVSAMGGQAGGAKSLELPGAGNLQE